MNKTGNEGITFALIVIGAAILIAGFFILNGQFKDKQESAEVKIKPDTLSRDAYPIDTVEDQITIDTVRVYQMDDLVIEFDIGDGKKFYSPIYVVCNNTFFREHASGPLIPVDMRLYR